MGCSTYAARGTFTPRAYIFLIHYIAWFSIIPRLKSCVPYSFMLRGNAMPLSSLGSDKASFHVAEATRNVPSAPPSLDAIWATQILVGHDRHSTLLRK